MGNRKRSQAPLSFGLRVGARQWWRIDVLSHHDKMDRLMGRSALPRIFLGLIVIFMMGHPTQSLADPRADHPHRSPRVQTLPHVPPGASEEQPRTNLFKQYAPALLTRTVYVAQAAAPYRVEMWDLLVGPRRKTDAVSLPGSAVLEVRSGEGLVTIDGNPQAVRMGSTFAIDEGSKFSIDNGQQHRPLSIRAIVISSQQE
jgi:hypothetical protein